MAEDPIRRQLRNKALKRVRRGAELLDERVPDWLNRVDSESLDVSNPRSCVLYQVWWGECEWDDARVWLNAVQTLVPGPGEAVRHGFDLESDYHDELESEVLNGVWRREIARRWASVVESE